MDAGLIVVVVALITLLSAATGSRTAGPGPVPVPGQPAQISSSISFDVDLPIANFDVVRDPMIEDSLRMYVARKAIQVTPDDARLIASQIIENCKTFDVNPRLAAAMIRRESRFNPRAVSPSGAMGLGQLLPSTASSLGVGDPFDIVQGTQGAVRYIRLMLDRFVGNPKQVVLALASYKEGYGTITRANGEFSDDTRRYIEDILRSVQEII